MVLEILSSNEAIGIMLFVGGPQTGIVRYGDMCNSRLDAVANEINIVCMCSKMVTSLCVHRYFLELILPKLQSSSNTIGSVFL